MPRPAGFGGIGHVLLQPLQADLHKAQAPLPVGIDAAAFAGQAHGIALQTADQRIDRLLLVVAIAVLVGEPTVLTQQAEQLSMEAGLGNY